MSTMSRPAWSTAHSKTVSLTVYLISMAVLIAALALTLAVSIADGDNSAGTGRGAGPRETAPAVPDYCNIRVPGSYC